MKVTVCINDTKIVVPCGDGDLSVRQLAELAIIRYRKTALSKSSFSEIVEINSLKLARDGGILDWDDKVHDVLDDRDLLIAQNGSNCSVTSPCPSSKLSSPPLPHHSIKNITSGDVINCNVSTSNLSNITHQLPQQPTVSTQNMPVSFGSSISHERFNSRHNSIPCSDQEINKRFEFDCNNVVNARHESLDDILDTSNPHKMLNYTNSLSKDYERWPLPPFPMTSTLQSSTEMTVIPKHLRSNFQDSDDQTWDNSPNDCDEEDYPRLRPDYIVKHFQNSQNKSVTGSVPSRQVLQWLVSQDYGSVSSSGGGGAGPSSYEVGSDNKESDSNNIPTDVLEDRNNNRVHASSSSVSSGNDHNRLKEETSSLDEMATQLLENSITVRLINPKAGENLGIQIIPAYLQTNAIEQISVHKLSEVEQKSIIGIEVHSIIPKGRVAKERQLNKGDKIIQINGVNLIGMAYEKGEALFRDALTKPECKLRVIPYQYPTIISAPIPINKPNPPPPPRRSPNTALSKGKPNLPSSSGSSEKGVLAPFLQQPSKSPIPSGACALKTANSKLTPALLPPGQQNPVASWTSGFGSMVHTPASSTSSVSALEKKKLDKMIANETIKTELIELTKIGSGFGFSITGKDNLPPTIPSAVYVRHILSDGAAIRDGRLKSGDRLLEVDGLLLDGMSQSEVIALLREKPRASRVKLLVERNPIKLSSQCSASHDSLMTSLSEMDEEGSTLSKIKSSTIKLSFDIPLNDCNHPTTLGISVKVEPRWDKPNINQYLSKEEVTASNIVWVKTVIENGAAYRDGKLMVGDQLLEINNQSLCGLSSDEALMKLKNIIKEAQESEDGMVHVVVQRKSNMARSSSLNTLNSMTGSGSANSFMPFYDPSRNMLSQKISSNHQIKNIPPLPIPPLSQHDAIDSELLPNPRSLAPDQPNFNNTKLSFKSTKRSAPVLPFPDPTGQPDVCITADKTTTVTKSKPAPAPPPPPPPPPLARRLKKPETDPNNLSSTFSTSTDFVSTTSGLICNPTVTTSVNFSASSKFKNPLSSNQIDGSSETNNIPFSLESNSTSNTLCRNKDNSQLALRTRNTRSNCSFTPTKDILHIDDIDWDKMELIPFANCEFASKFAKSVQINSNSQPAINQECQSKKFRESTSNKRRGLKKFLISQLFKSRHTNYHKPANSTGSSPIALRKQSDSTNNKISTVNDNPISNSKSSHSIKSTEQKTETEYPYAELDFGSSVYSMITDKSSALMSSPTNVKPTNANVSNLLPLPEESFSFLSNHSSENSDSYKNFVDVQSAIPGHISAVQRIAAAMPKQPSNRFVYEDAEELFQSLQANVSYFQDTLVDKNPCVPISTFKFPSLDNNENSSTKEDVYHSIFNASGLSRKIPSNFAGINTSNGFPRPLNNNQSIPNQNRDILSNSDRQMLNFSDSKPAYCNVQLLPK